MGTLFNIMTVFYGKFFGPLLACMICAVSHWRVRAGIMIVAMVAGCLCGTTSTSRSLCTVAMAAAGPRASVQ
jgi:hypothetical protein